MSVSVEFDLDVPMRDGTALKADVYRPDGPGPWPTLLYRTPYGRAEMFQKWWSGVDPAEVAKKGFIVALQDTRGRFGSDGEWTPMRHEREDGFDTVQWAAGLPGSSGRVAMYGGSYCANVQWLAAMEQPPALAAISPLLTWSDPDDGFFSRGGALELGLLLSWSLLTGIDTVVRRPGELDEIMGRVWAIVDDWDRLGNDGYWRLPVSELSALRPHEIRDLGSVAAMSDPEIADRTRVSGRHDLVEIPSLNTGGWYDVFLQGSIDNYLAMCARGVESRLVIGPWTHDKVRDPLGEGVFGLRSSRPGAPAHPYGDFNEFQLAWLRKQLEPEGELEFPSKPVRIFVMGRNEWRDESSWPPPGVVQERWFMHADGSLSTDSPAGGVSSYAYDPADPVPMRGGNVLASAEFPSGAFDQREIERRDDVVVFTSEPLDRELEVSGRVRAFLAVDSSAPSTDWVVRLCDVGPDGRSINICDGILRADSAPGPDGYEIDLWSTCNVFLPGHRLRVHVTSSCFPRWDRNLNTGDQDSDRIEVARQTLHHDAARACFVELPVMPR